MVDFDLEYKGGMALTIEVELATVNVLIPVTVTITEIVGRVRNRWRTAGVQAESPCSPSPPVSHVRAAPSRFCAASCASDCRDHSTAPSSM